jgi:hypothetical protein
MDKNEFAELLSGAFQRLPRLLDFESVEAEHTANIERMKSDGPRILEGYRVQALANAADEIAAKHAKADEDIRKKEAASHERQDAAEAELRRTYKLLEQAKGELERVNAQQAEAKRALHHFASRALAE